MASPLQSNETTATVAPDWYNQYMTGMASKGASVANNASYVGATPLQQQAFDGVTGESNTYKPQLAAAGQTLGGAAGMASPLSAGLPYLNSATTDPSQRAQGYMNPYMQKVVDNIGDMGQRNIRDNLVPQSEAGAIASGQFGSQRNAQVLGQTLSNADRDITNAQSTALQAGYQNAMDAAAKQNSLEAQIGQVASGAQSQGQQNFTQIGDAQGKLSSTNQMLGLNSIKAQADLGEQQRMLDQNRQLFPLAQQRSLSELLRGYQVPTSSVKTATQSTLSGLASVGALAGGVFGRGDPILDGNGNPTGRYKPSTASGIWGGLTDWMGRKVDSSGNVIDANGAGTNNESVPAGEQSLRAFNESNGDGGYYGAQTMGPQQTGYDYGGLPSDYTSNASPFQSSSGGVDNYDPFAYNNFGGGPDSGGA